MTARQTREGGEVMKLARTVDEKPWLRSRRS